MNQTKFDTFDFSKNRQTSKSLFYNHSVNTFMLQIYFIFTGLAIVISNGVFLWKLFMKKYKTRADKIFIILSCSDIGFGLFSIPIISLPLFKWDISAFVIHDAFDYIYHLIWLFSASFPYIFSWILVVIDRVNWQSFYHNKRANVQTIYHDENFKSDNNILLDFHVGNSNYTHNGL